MSRNSYPSRFSIVSVLHPIFHAFHATDGLILSPGVAAPEVRNAAAGVDDFSAAPDPPTGAVAVDHAYPVASGVVFHAVASDNLVAAADVFGTLFFPAYAALPQASSDIPPAVDVLIPASGTAVEVDSSGRPRFFAFPNID